MLASMLRSTLATGLIMLAGGLAPGLARAAAPVGEAHVDFPAFTPTGVTIDSAQAAVIGDVDGDGLPDTAAAVPSQQSGAHRTTVWVTYAPAATPSRVTAGRAGWRGFSIVGGNYIDDIAGLPDVNGDGRGEVALDLAGDVVVVYGQPDGTVVDRTALGSHGFTITGTQALYRPYGGTPSGARYIGHGIVSAGDQDGDGRADLAAVTGDGVAVVSTPSAGGSTVDATDPADVVFRLQTHASADPFVGRLGDLDGDGREDLMIAWYGDDGAVHVAGAAGTPLGTTVDLAHVADAGHGFLFDGALSQALYDAVTVADQNGDGRRDVILNTEMPEWPPIAASRVLTPALGTRAAFAPGRGELRLGVPFAGDLTPVGDLDRDGVEDVASGQGLLLSAFIRARPDGQPYTMETLLVGDVPDRSGDGRPEPVGLHAAAVTASTVAYSLDTYLTAPQLPVPQAGGPWPIPSGGPSPSAPPAPPAPVSAPALKPVVTHGFAGTAQADKLVGTPQADILRGLGGNDWLRGLGGDDRLEGGAGRDRLDAGAGNDTIVGGSGRDTIDAGAGNDVISARDGDVDTIRCGAGKDCVTADRRDMVSGCEKVSRPQKKTARRG